MEKLIGLLNSYERYKEWKYHHRNYIWKYDKQWGISAHRLAIQEEYLGEDESWAIIISKGYNFIKRLVENNKIEINNLSLKAFKNIFSGGGFVEVSDLEVLLMLLAISDTPIYDLISYLR